MHTGFSFIAMKLLELHCKLHVLEVVNPRVNDHSFLTIDLYSIPSFGASSFWRLPILSSSGACCQLAVLSINYYWKPMIQMKA
jgi:hypothetical protein